MKEITIHLYNNKTQQQSTKVTLNDNGYLYIAEDDVCIALDPEEVEKLLELLLNKNQLHENYNYIKIS